MRDADKVQEPMLDVAARGLPAARVPLPASPWLSRPQPRPHARARLYCFPHAGVGASVYRQWHAALPPEVEVCAVQLPGRENRLGEPALTRIADIVQALVLAIEPQSNLPFAFFGHSMGAVVAFELAHALARRGSAL
ncbi:MAG TPA: alpha/beta fold hydrolase, partial [Albitalea sp.]|nr:alpha/beta fold hydrolase [Albitalea sp.]